MMNFVFYTFVEFIYSSIINTILIYAHSPQRRILHCRLFSEFLGRLPLSAKYKVCTNIGIPRLAEYPFSEFSWRRPRADALS
jgi:hypothetical protein